METLDFPVHGESYALTGPYPAHRRLVQIDE